jgi:hypothetical protein
MRPPPGPFTIADLNARGDLQLKAEYRYADLEQVPGRRSSSGSSPGSSGSRPTSSRRRSRSTDDALVPLAVVVPEFRHRDPARGRRAGGGELLASGVNENTDTVTLETFQRHLLRELHDTGFEPAFALVQLTERPLSATFNFKSPDAHVDRLVAALADRCFAAAFFRFQGLA